MKRKLVTVTPEIYNALDLLVGTQEFNQVGACLLFCPFLVASLLTWSYAWIYHIEVGRIPLLGVMNSSVWFCRHRCVNFFVICSCSMVKSFGREHGTPPPPSPPPTCLAYCDRF